MHVTHYRVPCCTMIRPSLGPFQTISTVVTYNRVICNWYSKRGLLISYMFLTTIYQKKKKEKKKKNAPPDKDKILLEKELRSKWIQPPTWNQKKSLKSKT